MKNPLITNQRKSYLVPLSLIILAVIVILPNIALAAGFTFPGRMPRELVQEADIVDIVLNIVSYILYAAGIITVLFLIIGGIQYVISHGNSDLQEKAKKTITYAIAGAVIILISLVIVKTIGYLVSGERPFWGGF